MKFKAYSIAKEIDLNAIASKCNIPKKYTWEEPLILYGDTLRSILDKKIDEYQRILVFSFGSIVFINLKTEDKLEFFKYIKKNIQEVNLENLEKYSDDYELKLTENYNFHNGDSEEYEFELTDEYAIVGKYEPFYPELISTVIAKSVALEKSEEQLGIILDTIETIIEDFEKGSFVVSNKKLARTISKIVRHEYNTIAYIMILDKPDITWSNSYAARFYDKMSDFFELNDRYEIIKKKSDILNNIMGGFSSISHSMSALFVEWLIVILIVAEVILMIIELFK